MYIEYTVTDKYINKTIRNLLENEFDISKNLLIKLKKENKILCNNIITSVNYILNKNDFIFVDLNFIEDNSNIVPTKVDLNIVYEDDYYLVINKPPHMPIHPSCNNYTNTLSNGIRYYFDTINLKRKIRPVNRLDKDTSGLVIFAKSEYIQECLIKQMKNNTFEKYYIGVLDGLLENDKGTIDLPIARKLPSIIERCIDENGEKSITHYKVLNKLKNMTLVEFKLDTGRTHQIRVHSKAIGHPIVGDTLYGTASELIDRQALHSYKISFIHPIAKECANYVADIPKDFYKLF